MVLGSRVSHYFLSLSLRYQSAIHPLRNIPLYHIAYQSRLLFFGNSRSSPTNLGSSGIQYHCHPIPHLTIREEDSKQSGATQIASTISVSAKHSFEYFGIRLAIEVESTESVRRGACRGRGSRILEATSLRRLPDSLLRALRRLSI